jgi:hypothetical protein
MNSPPDKIQTNAERILNGTTKRLFKPSTLRINNFASQQRCFTGIENILCQGISWLIKNIAQKSFGGKRLFM